MTIELKIISSTIIFLLSIIAGIWLSNKGKPYNNFVFTIHKLTALAATVLITIMFVNLIRNDEVTSFIAALEIAAGISIISLFASGALLSIGKMSYILTKTIHIIASIIAAVTTPLSIYLFLKK